MCLGVPGRIVEILSTDFLQARVDVGGRTQDVSLAMVSTDGVAGPGVGDWVVVHLGLAMACLDEHEARHMVDSLQELSDLYEQVLSDGPAHTDERAVDEVR